MTTNPPDPLFVLRGINDSVTSISFVNPGEDVCTRHLMAGTQGGATSIWDLKTKALVHHWNAHEGTSVLWLRSLCPKQIWSQGRNDGVKLWDLNQDSPLILSSFPVSQYLGFCQCDITDLQNGHSLIAMPGPEQEIISIHDVKTENKICRLRHPNSEKEGTIMHVKWINVGSQTLLLIAYESGSLVLWDWSNKAILSSINIGENPMCVEFNNFHSRGVCGTAGETLVTFNISPSGELSSDKKIKITNPGIASCTSRHDGKIFATGGWDYRIRIFTWKKVKPLAVLLYHRQTVQCLTYSVSDVEQFPSGTILAAGSMDQSISLWNLLN